MIVHIGCGDGRLTAALRADDHFLVHGLDRDDGNVERTRECIKSLGGYGPASVEHWDGNRLPYADNLVGWPGGIEPRPASVGSFPAVGSDRRGPSRAAVVEAGAGTDQPPGPGEIRVGSDGRWAHAHQRRPHADLAALHAPGGGRETAPGSSEVAIAGPAFLNLPNAAGTAMQGQMAGQNLLTFISHFPVVPCRCPCRTTRFELSTESNCL